MVFSPSRQQTRVSVFCNHVVFLYHTPNVFRIPEYVFFLLVGEGNIFNHLCNNHHCRRGGGGIKKKWKMRIGRSFFLFFFLVCVRLIFVYTYTPLFFPFFPFCCSRLKDLCYWDLIFFFATGWLAFVLWCNGEKEEYKHIRWGKGRGWGLGGGRGRCYHWGRGECSWHFCFLSLGRGGGGRVCNLCVCLSYM